MKTNTALRRAALIGIALAIMALFCVLPAPQGLPREGMQVLGIFLGVLLLWLTIGIDWPSLLCLLCLAQVQGLTMGSVLTSSVGNSTFAFLMFTFMCTYTLSETSFIRRCAAWFVNSRLAQKGPWHFAALFFASVLFLGSFISPTVLFVVYLPILEEIYRLTGLEKGSKTASMFMMGLVFCCGISSGMTPIAHVFPIMAMGYYNTATGGVISYGVYMAFGIPVGLLCAGLMMLVFRFLLRPEMNFSSGAGVETSGEITRKEKLTVAVFAFIVALWVLPSLLSGVLPTLCAKLSALGTAFPPLLGAVLLNILTDGGKPLMNFKDAMAKGVPWSSLIMCAATLALGSALTNSAIGITAWVGEAITPLTQGLAPFALVLLFAVWAAVQTNLSSNMVTVTVVCAVALPVCMAVPGVNAGAVCAVIGMLASCAFATPPAMPCVAIAGASGWTNAGSLLKYGMLMAFMCALVSATLGYGIAAMLLA